MSFRKEQKKPIPRKYLQRNLRIGENRYRIDEFVMDNGMVVSYEGYDTFRKRKVIVRELFPSAIVDRNLDQEYKVFCKKLSDERMFYSMKEHMARKAKKLIGLYPVEGIANVLTCFEERDTIYLIEEKFEGQTLKEFLYKRHSAKFTVEDIMRQLGPVMETLSYLHKKGIVHGTVYPEHILLSTDGRILLTNVVSPIEDVAYEGLGEPAIRQDGYSPVELYLPMANKGPAMDIYELGAIFYRYVTGAELPAYFLRINENDETTDDPATMKLMVMQHQAEAIMKALSIYDFDRYQTVEEFKQAIWQEDVLPMMEQPGMMIQNQKPYEYDQKEKENKTFYRVLIIGLVIAAVVLIPGFIKIGTKMGTTRFYEKLLAATEEEQCRTLLSLNKADREKYTNDYYDMNSSISDEEQSQQFEAKYYDLIIGRNISQKELNQKDKVYDYIRLDYRKNEIWLTHITNEETKQTVFQISKQIDGTHAVSVSTTTKDGKSETENLFVKP